jgi:hypothetical protein
VPDSPLGPRRSVRWVGLGPASAGLVKRTVQQALPWHPLYGIRKLQPEVHLHPRAQAASGSFFVRLAKEERKQFVIETHSDYLVDRIRIDIAEGLISHLDVSVLFFERSQLGFAHPKS